MQYEGYNVFRKFLHRIARSMPLYREILQIRNALPAIEAEIYGLRTDSLLSGDPRYADARRLHRYAFTVNSAGGEDGLIQEIFRRIGVMSRVFVEVGVGDGTENNTAFLLSTGWTGFWIDGNDAVLQTLSGRRDLR